MTEIITFNYVRNRSKLFANLISIIDGLLSDGALDSKEVLYLDTWLLEAEAISNNYCVKTIKRRLSDILADGVIEKVELEFLKADLITIQKDLLDIPNIDLFSEDADKHLLEGLCKGMIANQELNDSEIRYLNWFLSKNAALKNNYPGKELYAVVKQILDDGVITEEERNTLKSALIDFTGSNIEEGVVDGLSTSLPLDAIDSLELDGATVCLTGEFLYGKRSVCEDEFRASGAKISSSVTQKIDYLVIGTLCARDWRFQSYGRKIEKAVSYRDEKGTKLKIISEEQWKSFA
jgi:hypothetical protein